MNDHLEQFFGRTVVAHFSFVLANALVLFAFSVIFLTNAFYAFGLTNTGLPLFLALGLALCGLVFNFRLGLARMRMPACSALAVLFLAIVTTAMWMGLQFHEYSADGQTYHAEARMEFADGKNPFRDEFSDIRVQEFPNGAYVFAVNFHKLTGLIDGTRPLNAIMLWASFLTVFGTVLRMNSQWWSALLVAGTAALNTITIAQLFSFYVDGILASLVTIVVFMSLLLCKEADGFIMLSLSAAVAILISIKLTGGLYALIMFGGIEAWCIFRELRSRWKKAQPKDSIPKTLMVIFLKERKKLVLVCAGFVIGSCFFGFSSYVKTMYRHGDLLHVYGPDVETFFRMIPESIPKNWLAESPTRRLLLSIFSVSKVAGAENAELKLPFTVLPDEVDSFYTGDHRRAGLGPLFSGAFVLSLFVLILMVNHLPNPGGLESQCLSIIFLLALSVLVNPMGWQARFAPQLGLIPVFALWYAFSNNQRSVLMRLLALALSVTLIANIWLVGSSYLRQQVAATRQIKSYIDHLAALPLPAAIFFNNRFVFKAYLDEAARRKGAPTFTRVPRKEMLGCNAPEVVPFSGQEVLVCKN
jgi:hypothetical protein